LTAVNAESGDWMMLEEAAPPMLNFGFGFDI
jgi:hypothetical protein